MNKLNELQQDILTEAFNLGMGSAAASLSEIVRSEISLSVPNLTFIDKQTAAKRLSQNTESELSGVSESFTGPFCGKALLLFPAEQSLALVRLMLQDSVPLESLTEFEEEALNEIGNIILNAGLGSLADMFGSRIETEIPTYTHGSTTEIFDAQSSANDLHDVVLFLQVDFSIKESDIHGFVVYLLDVDSMKDLTNLLDVYLSKIS